jgi:hypothetical protein
MLKSNCENIPLQVGELFSIWNEVQREFADHVKEGLNTTRRGVILLKLRIKPASRE